jgi:hypothetical protein
MHEAGVKQGAREELAQKRKAWREVICRCCGSDRVYRLFREGFLQKKIYPMFGFYPWRCRTCATTMMLQKRKRAKRTMRAN